MTPDYVLCLECESPCYIFEYNDGKITEALCTVCYNDDSDAFATEDDYEALAMDTRFGSHG